VYAIFSSYTRQVEKKKSRLKLSYDLQDQHSSGQTHLSRLIDLASRGNEIVIIAKSGKPVARLVAYAPKGKARRPGRLRGKIRMKKNFDGPLPKELLDSFEGKS
jgi:antitoxin (DNA-binding transcriptional repressor) of toxin-antitoxin stability system